MKKANNILFIILCIICFIILFTYLGGKCKAVDFSADSNTGPANPDGSYEQPEPRPNVQNTIVVSPPEVFNQSSSGSGGSGGSGGTGGSGGSGSGSGTNPNNPYLPTHPINNTNIFSGQMNFTQYNENFSSDRMYYTPYLLNNYKFVYESWYYIAIPLPVFDKTNLGDFDEMQVKVKVYDTFNNEYNVDAIFYNTGHFYNWSVYSPKNYLYITADDNQFYANPMNDLYGYDFVVGVLRVNMPILDMFDRQDTDLQYLKNGFYIGGITFNVNSYTGLTYYEGSCTSISHIFDICYIDGQFSVPQDTTLYYTVCNNIGNFRQLYGIEPNANYTLLTRTKVGDLDLETYSTYSDYKFDTKEGSLIYTAINTSNSTNYTDYMVFTNEKFLSSFLNGSTALETIFEFARYDPFYLMSLIDRDRLMDGLYFYNIQLELVNESNVSSFYNVDLKNTCPYYSSFKIFVLNPEGDYNISSNITFDDINAEKYYVEPSSNTDFLAYFNNAIVWLCFECPIFSNLTKPMYIFLNSFLKIWTDIAIPLATSMGLIGGALIFYVIYKFISHLVFH